MTNQIKHTYLIEIKGFGGVVKSVYTVTVTPSQLNALQKRIADDPNCIGYTITMIDGGLSHDVYM